ncbi:hypothetical protein ILUMI_03900 [Ignelater luminosus]|uniref:Anoctamin n=1 Tax=Ignelater luminosus TaxID=2038154 RepID=A0A8K0GJI0_IGNLU|nr:hypothetical protein ILUMI_03900 [Ignelater luminosus]
MDNTPSRSRFRYSMQRLKESLQKTIQAFRIYEGEPNGVSAKEKFLAKCSFTSNSILKSRQPITTYTARTQSSNVGPFRTYYPYKHVVEKDVEAEINNVDLESDYDWSSPDSAFVDDHEVSARDRSKLRHASDRPGRKSEGSKEYIVLRKHAHPAANKYYNQTTRRLLKRSVSDDSFGVISVSSETSYVSQTKPDSPPVSKHLYYHEGKLIRQTPRLPVLKEIEHEQEHESPIRRPLPSDNDRCLPYVSNKQRPITSPKFRSNQSYAPSLESSVRKKPSRKGPYEGDESSPSGNISFKVPSSVRRQVTTRRKLSLKTVDIPSIKPDSLRKEVPAPSVGERRYPKRQSSDISLECTITNNPRMSSIEKSPFSSVESVSQGSTILVKPLCGKWKTRNKTRASGCRGILKCATGYFFNDGRRMINYVLVYTENDIAFEGSQDLQVEYFLSNLEKRGLELESVHGGDESVFVKVHIPIETLYYEMKQQRIHFTCILPFEAFIPASKFTCMNIQYDRRIQKRNLESVFGLQPQEPTSAEKIMVIHEILNTTKFGERDEDYNLDEIIKLGVLTTAYPLHDGTCTWSNQGTLSDRQLLKYYWGKVSRIKNIQPLPLINKYFGPEIAFYFAWFGYFIYMSIPMVLLGIMALLYGLFTIADPEDARITDICEERLGKIYICPHCLNFNVCDFSDLKDSCHYSKLNYVFDNSGTAILAFVMAAWALMFMIHWKKWEKSFKSEWNLYYEDEDTYVRSSFLRHLQRSQIKTVLVNGQPHMPRMRTFVVRSLSALYVLLFIIIMCIIVFSMGLIRIALTETIGLSTKNVSVKTSKGNKGVEVVLRSYASIITSIITSLLSAIFIILCSQILPAVSDWLTKIEHPRKQDDYNKSFITKLFILECFNNYTPAFYLSFAKGAYFTYPGDNTTWTSKGGINADLCDASGCIADLSIYIGIVLTIKMLYSWISSGYLIYSASRRIPSPKTSQWELDYMLNDVIWYRYIARLYIDLIIKYGFMIFFIAVLPLAPLIVFVDNILTLRLNAILFCQIIRRPVPRRILDIKIWNRIIAITTIIGVLTNAFVIAFATDIVSRTLYYQGRNKTDTYVNSTLSEFEVKEYVGVKQSSKVAKCYYRSKRNPASKGTNKYTFSEAHFKEFYYKCVFVNIIAFCAVLCAVVLYFLAWSYIMEDFRKKDVGEEDEEEEEYEEEQ